MALFFSSYNPRLVLLSSSASTVSSTLAITAIPFIRSTKELRSIRLQPINGLLFHNSVLIPKGRRELIAKATESGVDGTEEALPKPPAESEGSNENVQVQDLPLESKLQLKLEQKLKMKLAKKIRLRRKRLVQKRKLRKKGKWPPSKINRNV